jgi:hypothetical protein
MPTWWESRFNFSPTQKIIKHSGLPYNNNSMSKQQHALAKDIYSAMDLIDLAACLAGYIWMEAYEGEDVSDLTVALETIKAAAADEISEPSEFPETLAVAIENACQALNITKVEELKKMAETKKTIEKAGVNVVDGDPRDASAATVSEVINGTTPIKPAATAVPKKVYAADGKTTTSKSADVTTEDPENPPPPDDADDQIVNEDEAAEGELDKSTKTGDLAKSILAGVETLIEKAVSPLKEEIDALKKSPAASKRAGSFVDVEKIEEDPINSEMSKNKARFDELMVKADHFAAHPEVGSVQDRVAIGIELRKLSRLMDPASRAQHAAIRASFPAQPGL